MVAEIQMPALSPTMTEGKIISWLKKEGDKVNIGDVILEAETDKAIMEVESQSKGILGKILYDLDTVVKVGETIALILEKGENFDILNNYKISSTSNQQEQENEQTTNNINDNSDVKINDIIDKTVKAETKIYASPLAKKIAKINNVDITNINGSGPNGRIIRDDVERFLKNCNTQSTVIGRDDVEYVDVEPSMMRKTIAKRLTESKQQIPHWYMKTIVDMTETVKFRELLNASAKIIDDKPEFKISINDIIVFAVAKVLKKHPDINISWYGDKIRKYNNIDVSVACSVENGIYTPIIKNAEQLSLFDISRQIKKFAKMAKNNELNASDYSGGNITISNLGMFDVEEFSSIINTPQSCIIAVGKVQKQPVVINNNIVVRDMCALTFSADHRVIDGAVLAKFVKDVKTMLEHIVLSFF